MDKSWGRIRFQIQTRIWGSIKWKVLFFIFIIITNVIKNMYFVQCARLGIFYSAPVWELK
jgi:hypothetical protein